MIEFKDKRGLGSEEYIYKGSKMSFSEERLKEIFEKTSGRCHICQKNLSFKNYGLLGTKAPWEVEHSTPKAKGGTDHLNNLYPACISCNRSKGKKSNRIVRAKHGNRIAPLSTKKRKEAKANNALWGGAIGAVAGRLIFGPVGAVAVGIAGAVLGHDRNPDRDA